MSKLEELVQKLVQKWPHLEKVYGDPKTYYCYRCAVESTLAAQPGLTEEQVREFEKDIQFRRKCGYSEDWLEGYRTARTEECPILLASQGAPLPTTSTAVYLGPYTGSAEPAPAQPEILQTCPECGFAACKCPASAAPEVDLVEKWRKLSEDDHVEVRADDEYAEYYNGRSIAASTCAEELAAWLPAHDAKVRAKALEEAAKWFEVHPGMYAAEFVAENLRALAAKPGPNGDSDGER